MKRAFAWILVALFVIAAGVGAVYALRDVLIAPRLETLLADTVKSTLGLGIRVDRVGGTYFTSFELIGVETTEPSSTGPLVSVGLKQARLEYSLVSLLGGVDAFLRKTSIELDGLRLELDVSRKSPPQEEEPSEPATLVLPGALPRVHVEDAAISLIGEGYRLGLVGLSITTRPVSEASTAIGVSAADLVWEHPNLRQGSTSLQGELNFTRESLAVESFSLGEIRVIESARLDLKGLPGAVAFEGKLRGFGALADVSARRQNTAVEARWEVEGLSLDEFSSFVLLPEVRLAGTVDTGGTLRVDTSRPADLTGDLTVGLTQASIQGIPVGQANLRASAGQGALRVEQLDLQTGKNVVTLSEVTAPSEAVFSGDVDRLLEALTGAFSLALEDIPSLLRAAEIEFAPPGTGIPPHRLSLDGSVSAATLSITGGQLVTETGNVRLDSVEVLLPVAGRAPSDATIRAAVRVDLPELAQVAALFPLPSLAGSLHAQVDVNGTLADPSGVAQADAKELVYQGIPLGALTVHARGDRQSVFVRSLELRRGSDRVSGRGMVDLVAGRLEDVFASVSIEDLGAYDDLIPDHVQVGGRPIRVDGRLSAQIDVEGPFTEPVGVVEIQGSNLGFQGQPVGDVTMRGRTEAGTVTIESLLLHRGQDHLKASGAMELATKQLDDVLLSFAFRDLGAYQEFIPEGARAEGKRIRLAGSLTGNVSLEGPLHSPRGAVEIGASNVAFQGHRLGDVALMGKADAGRVVLESLELRRGQDRVAARGSLELATRKLDDVSLSVTARNLSAYEEFIPENVDVGGRPIRVDGRLAVQVGLEGALENLRGVAQIDGSNLAFQGRPIGDVSARIEADPERIRVDSFEVTQGQDRISGRGAYDLTSRHLGEVSVELSVQDIGAYTEGLVPDEWALAGRVLGTLKAAGPLAEPDARLEFSVTDARFADVEAPGATLRARSAGRQVWIEQADVKTSLGEVSLSGTVTRGPDDKAFDAVLEAMSVSWKGVRLQLDGPARLAMSEAGVYEVHELGFSGAVGSLRADGVLALEGESDLTVTVSQLTGEGWLEALVGDRLLFEGLDAQIRVSGAAASPSLALSGTVAKVVGTQPPIPLSGRFDLGYGREGIELRQLEFSGEGDPRIAVAGRIPLDPLAAEKFLPGELSLQLEADVPDVRIFRFLLPADCVATGSLRSDVKLEGSWEAPQGRLRIDAQNLDVSLPGHPALPGPFALVGAVDLEGSQISVRELRLDSPSISVDGSGRWTGAPLLGRAVRGEELELTGDVYLKASATVSDVGWAAKWVEDLRRVTGKLEADVLVEGPARAPDFAAQVRLSGAEVRPRLAIPSIREVSLDAEVRPNAVSVREASGQLGGAPFRLSGTWERQETERARVDVHLQGDNLLLYRDEGVKVRADTDLTVTGPVSRLEIAGDVAITDGRLVKNIELLGALRGSGKPAREGGFRLFSVRDPPMRDAVFRVRISSKNPFGIKTNLARGTVRPELLLAGSGENPYLVGEVYVEPIRIRLPAGTLTVQSGVIRFLENEPDRPRLDLVAGAKMLGYDVTVLIEGPYDEPVVTLSSVPPLPEGALLLLVLAGQPPQTTMGRDAAQSQSLSVAVYLGRDLLSKWFGDDSVEAEESVLDRFELEIGRGVTRTGDETLDAQFRLARGLIRDGDALYLTGQKDVYDEFNAGLKLVFRFQ